MADCPDCGQTIWRLDGDWLLRCHRCGWVEGWPMIRWITHAIPRTLIRIGVFRLGVAFFLLAVALGIAGGWTPSSAMADGLNETSVEQQIHEGVNEHRAEDLAYNERAASAAEQHAEDMAEHDYFNHTSPSGVTQQERYAFCDGAENAAKTYYEREVRVGGEVSEFETESELSAGVVDMWMQSDPHRERGIYGDWTSAGVGVATDGDEVYAVMGFCRR